MLKRLFAVLTTAVLALGLSLGAAAPASANNVTCNSIGYTKFDASSGSETLPWGQLTWSGQTLTYVLGAGWSVDLCVKSGAQAGTSTYQDVTGTGSVTIGQGISHIGYKDPVRAPGLTCDVATLYKSGPLTNGDHINMDVVIDGVKQQVNAYVDLWQTGDPTPKLSDYVMKITPKTGPQFKVSIPQANVDSGILAFEYSSGWTGSWTVEWVQYNSQYFNQDRNSAKFLHCQDDTPVVVSTAPSATAPTCDVDGKLVLPSVTGITWTGGTNGAGPGAYTVKAEPATGYTLNGAQDTWTITVKAKGDGVNCVEAVEPTLTIAECDATSGALKSAYLTIPLTANLAYSINGGAAFTAGQKVDVAAGTHVVDVVATNGHSNTGPSSFTIVVSAFDCDKAVKPALTLAVCDIADNTLTPAFITIPTTTPGLEYRISGVNGGAALSGDVQLAAGSHTVNVTAKAGYQNTGPASFTVVVPAVTCEKSVEPALTLAVCHPTTGAFQSAFITIPTTTPGLEYRIAGQNGDQPLVGDVNLPAGTYTVTVTATPGVTNTGQPSFTVVVPALSCEESVEPSLTVAQCDVASGAFTPAFITIPATTPGLEYRISGVNGGAALSGKVELAAGAYTVDVTAKPGYTNTGATSFPVTVDALSCEEAVEPNLTVAQCDVAGAVVSASLTATTTTPGLTYTIRGGAVLTPGVAASLPAGVHIVDVTAAAGVTNTGQDSFTITIDAFGCDEAVEPKLTIAECSALTGPTSAFITIPTTTPGLIYSIGGADYAAGAKVDLPAGPYTVDVRAAAGFSNTGPSSFSGTVAAVDCEGEDYVEPTVTPQTCDLELGGTNDGSLLFTLNPDLEYWLDGVEVTTALVSNVATGDHTIKVVPAAGHFITGGVDTFTVNVPAAVGCDNVYTTPLDPFAAPAVCDPQSTATLDGSITVVHVAGVQWHIGTQADGSDKVAVGDDTTTGNVTYDYPAGDYFVFAEAVDPTISIKPGHEVFPLTVDFPSQLCTLGFFEPSATAAPAVCDAAGDGRGTITVDLMPGVTYAFQGGPTITTATTRVAPGAYTVVATPDDPRSALSQDTWVLTVTAPALVLCDLTTLALTGQNANGVWIVAIILLQAGLVLVAVQFVRMRRARHLAR